jgi:two-component system chemotaxis response regulator CheB
VSDVPYRVLAIGAAADSLPRALVLLAALPEDFPAPVALACERDADERDALLERVRAAARLPVIEPDDKDDLEPGRLYLSPAGYHLVLDRGAVALARDPTPAPPSAAPLFESAADTFGASAAAVLFCGERAPAGAEEALERVRACGGLALRADPALDVGAILGELRGGVNPEGEYGRKDEHGPRG